MVKVKIRLRMRIKQTNTKARLSIYFTTHPHFTTTYQIYYYSPKRTAFCGLNVYPDCRAWYKY